MSNKLWGFAIVSDKITTLPLHIRTRRQRRGETRNMPPPRLQQQQSLASSVAIPKEDSNLRTPSEPFLGHEKIPNLLFVLSDGMMKQSCWLTVWLSAAATVLILPNKKASDENLFLPNDYWHLNLFVGDFFTTLIYPEASFWRDDEHRRTGAIFQWWSLLWLCGLSGILTLFMIYRFCFVSCTDI